MGCRRRDPLTLEALQKRQVRSSLDWSAFCDRWRRLQGAADDPRWSNPLFKDWAAAARNQDVEPCVPKQ